MCTTSSFEESLSEAFREPRKERRETLRGGAPRGKQSEQSRTFYLRVEKKISIGSLWSGLGGRLASSGLFCGLIALLAFLPLAGLALISPSQVQSDNSWEFFWGAVLLSRLLTPPVASLIVAYLARKDGRISSRYTLLRLFSQYALSSVGLVLGVAVFTLVSSLFFVLPGVAFALATCVVLPVKVVEGVQGPRAVERSWSLTKDHRVPLLLFWLGFFVVSVVFLGGVFALSAERMTDLYEPLPLVQEQSFLPLVAAVSFVYGTAVIASYQIYQKLTD